MSVSARSLLVPGLALATAGAMALTPAVTAAPTAAPALPTLPAVHVEEIALAGIGRDIYNEITDFVQYTVSSAQFWIDLIPFVGPPLADQLGIIYFDGIQPLIADTVYYVSDLIADPVNFVGLTINYGYNVFYTGYNFVSAEAQAFGLPGLAPIPAPAPLASVAPPSRGAAAAVAAETPKVAAVRAEVGGRAARAAAATPRPAAARAAADTDAVDDAAQAPSPKHSAKSARGAARSAAAD